MKFGGSRKILRTILLLRYISKGHFTTAVIPADPFTPKSNSEGRLTPVILSMGHFSSAMFSKGSFEPTMFSLGSFAAVMISEGHYFHKDTSTSQQTYFHHY